MDAILRAKNYWLGILLALPTLYGYYISAKAQSATNAMIQVGEDNPENIAEFFSDLSSVMTYVVPFIIFTMIGLTVYLLWTWSVAHHFHPHLPVGTNLKLKSYRGAIIGQIVGMIVFYVVIFVLFGNFLRMFQGVAAGAEPNQEIFKDWLIWVPVVVLVGLISFAAQVYVAYFIGKTLKSVELGRPSKGGETAGYAVLTYLLVIGAWILQPKVNRFVETGEMEPGGSENVW